MIITKSKIKTFNNKRKYINKKKSLYGSAKSLCIGKVSVIRGALQKFDLIILQGSCIFIDNKDLTKEYRKLYKEIDPEYDETKTFKVQIDYYEKDNFTDKNKQSINGYELKGTGSTSKPIGESINEALEEFEKAIEVNKDLINKNQVNTIFDKYKTAYVKSFAKGNIIEEECFVEYYKFAQVLDLMRKIRQEFIKKTKQPLINKENNANKNKNSESNKEEFNKELNENSKQEESKNKDDKNGTYNEWENIFNKWKNVVKKENYNLFTNYCNKYIEVIGEGNPITIKNIAYEKLNDKYSEEGANSSSSNNGGSLQNNMNSYFESLGKLLDDEIINNSNLNIEDNQDFPQIANTLNNFKLFLEFDKNVYGEFNKLIKEKNIDKSETIGKDKNKILNDDGKFSALVYSKIIHGKLENKWPTTRGTQNFMNTIDPPIKNEKKEMEEGPEAEPQGTEREEEGGPGSGEGTEGEEEVEKEGGADEEPEGEVEGEGPEGGPEREGEGEGEDGEEERSEGEGEGEAPGEGEGEGGPEGEGEAEGEAEKETEPEIISNNGKNLKTILIEESTELKKKLGFVKDLGLKNELDFKEICTKINNLQLLARFNTNLYNKLNDIAKQKYQGKENSPTEGYLEKHQVIMNRKLNEVIYNKIIHGKLTDSNYPSEKDKEEYKKSMTKNILSKFGVGGNKKNIIIKRKKIIY